MSMWKLRSIPRLLALCRPVSSFNAKVTMVGSSTQFLRVYFNFGYYMSLVPFRFHRNRSSDRTIIKNSSRIKKGCCLLVHVMICGCYSVSSIREFQQQVTQHLDFYFFVLWKLFSVLYMLAYFETVWRHSIHFLNILTQLDHEEEIISRGKLPFYDPVPAEGGLSKKKVELTPSARIVATIICAAYTIPSFVIVFSAQLFSDSPTWDVYTNIYLYCTRARQLLFFQNVAKEEYHTVPDELSAGDYALGLFYATFQFFNYLRDYYSDLLLLCCVFTIRSLSRRFARFLNNHSQASPAEICRKYNLVRDINHQINEIMWISFGLVLLQAPRQFMDSVTKEHQTALSFLYGILATMTFFVIMYNAAAVVDDMREIKNWLRNGNSTKMHAPELLLVLEEVEHAPFGVKGIGTPVITFGFVRIIVMIMVAYGILMVQLAPSDCHCTCQITYLPETTTIG